MTRIVVKRLIWSAWVKNHIKKHNVTPTEIRESIRRSVTHTKGHTGRYLLIGRAGTRIISTVVRREKMNVYYVVTARDSDKKERRKLYEKEKK